MVTWLSFVTRARGVEDYFMNFGIYPRRFLYKRIAERESEYYWRRENGSLIFRGLVGL